MARRWGGAWCAQCLGCRAWYAQCVSENRGGVVCLWNGWCVHGMCADLRMGVCVYAVCMRRLCVYGMVCVRCVCVRAKTVCIWYRRPLSSPLPCVSLSSLPPLDSEVASLSSQDIQDLLVDTALRVARSRRGIGSAGRAGGQSAALLGDNSDVGVNAHGGGSSGSGSVYGASVRSLHSPKSALQSFQGDAGAWRHAAERWCVDANADS